ncbi:MAG: hypothetical protein IJU23_13865 [Proteobacteria bacterium]|nr:hypothetical protein [Pseudomonadota bacterium]
MIFSRKALRRDASMQITSMQHLRHLPQLPVWENVARQMIQKNNIHEACYIIDLIARYYGKQAGRIALERVIGIKTDWMGRGLTLDCLRGSHPALFVLRDWIRPLQVGDKVCLRNGENVVLASPDGGEFRILSALSENPKPTVSASSNNGFVDWIAIDSFLVFSRGDTKLHIVDLSNIPSDDQMLDHAELEFSGNIHRLCGPLSDGTFFITLEPQIPILSDICRLCVIDFDKVREKMRQCPGESFDVRSIGAVGKDIVLSNTEQTLLDDCQAGEDEFLTCGGGMQNREVRFISGDGSWTTRFVHESRVIRIIRSERGLVSLDETGHAFLWEGRNVVDDIQFCFEKMPEIFRDNLEETDFSIDWGHGQLYLTAMLPPQSTLDAALKASYSCCMTVDGADVDAFVKKKFPLKDMELAMFADGSIHFWDMTLDCVDLRWQLSKYLAEQADWQAILATRSPAIELDPRIRVHEEEE